MIGSHTPPKTAIFISGGEVENVKGHFCENTSSNVGAVLLHCDLLVFSRRRSEIGSHTPPKTAIFIRGGEVENVMGYSSTSKFQKVLHGYFSTTFVPRSRIRSGVRPRSVTTVPRSALHH